MAPLAKRDWGLYEEHCRAAHIAWLRSLTPAEAFSLYEEFHRFAASLPSDPEGRERLERERWNEKLACRRRMVEAFQRLDRMASDGRAAKFKELPG